MLQAVHRKSFTQLSAKFRSKDPSIVRMLWAVHRKSFTQLSAKFRSKDPGIVGMLQAVHRESFTQLRLLPTFAGALREKNRTRASFNKTPTNYIS